MMSNIQGVFLNGIEHTAVYKGNYLFWEKPSKVVELEALGGGQYKAKTTPNVKYKLTLNQPDYCDISSEVVNSRYLLADIRNSNKADRIIDFTAKSNETYFRLYGSFVEIIELIRI